uniref:Uncharacterized protein n=1 Tax=Cannabis sativa TaxID=3483 RepID=A0A803NTR2_CANSA
MHEEKYNGEPDVELNENVQPENCSWWGSHTELVHDNADESDIGDEVEMGSVHSDEENEATTPYKIQFKCEMQVFPIPSPDKWPKTGENTILPPGENILLGMPKKKRGRSVDEPPPQLAQRLEEPVQLCIVEKASRHNRGIARMMQRPQPQGPKNKGRRPHIQNPTKETLKRRKRMAKEKARKAAQGDGAGSSAPPKYAGGSNA